jgi:hypothetical protein
MAGFVYNKKMKISKRKESKAYHEASHAIIALRLGRMINTSQKLRKYTQEPLLK